LSERVNQTELTVKYPRATAQRDSAAEYRQREMEEIVYSRISGIVQDVDVLRHKMDHVVAETTQTRASLQV